METFDFMVDHLVGALYESQETEKICTTDGGKNENRSYPKK